MLEIGQTYTNPCGQTRVVLNIKQGKVLYTRPGMGGAARLCATSAFKEWFLREEPHILRARRQAPESAEDKNGLAHLARLQAIRRLRGLLDELPPVARRQAINTLANLQAQCAAHEQANRRRYGEWAAP